MGIMVITTSGLPPFAAFFSKGLIISSVTSISAVSLTSASTIQAIILYATAAITFAYVIRMFSLVFMGKESEHLVKQHPHEAPKSHANPCGNTFRIMYCVGFIHDRGCKLYAFR